MALVPGAGDALQGSAEAALKRLQQAEATEERLRDLNDQLAELGYAVLVVVDDVDRLLPDELTALLKAIRLLGRFPNIHYLLAYDEQTVLDVLRHTAVASGDLRRAQAYLDKVVQVRLDVPPLQRAQAERLLDRGLAQTLERLGAVLDPADQQRFAAAYQVVLRRTLTEPRVLQRYLVQVDAFLPHVGVSEVDVVDFLLVTYLRTTYPLLHRRLAAEQRQLTDEGHWWGLSQTGQSNQAEDAQPWSSSLREAGVPDSENDLVLALLASLYPGVHTHPGRSVVLGSYQPSPRRVGDPQYIERYFALGVPVDDIADAVVAEALTEISAGWRGPARDRLEAVLLPAGEPDAALQARTLGKLAAASAGLQPHEAAAALQFLLSAYPGLPHAEATLLGGPVELAETWASLLLERLSGWEEDGQNRQRQERGVSPDELLASLTVNPDLLTMTIHALELGSRRGGSGGFSSRLAGRAASMALQRGREHLECRDEAPEWPARTYLEFASAQLGQAVVRDASIDDLENERWSAEDLAARYVPIKTIIGTGVRRLGDFDAEGLERLVPPEILARYLPSESAPPGGVVPPDGDRHDLSWANRRRHAGRALRRLTASISDRPLPTLPAVLNVEETRPPAVAAYGARQFLAQPQFPDLNLRVAAVFPPVPPGELSPEDGGDAAGLHGAARDRAVIEAFEAGAFTAWLRDQASPWHLGQLPSWRLHGEPNTGGQSSLVLQPPPQTRNYRRSPSAATSALPGSLGPANRFQ